MYECHHDVYSNIQIIYLWILETLIEVRGCAYWSGSHSDNTCIFADIGDSDRSARMRILVRIVTFHVYECRHDVYSDIQIIFLWILETLI